MKMFRCIIVVMLFVGGVAARAADTNLLLRVEGLTFSNVTFGTVTPATVTIFHSTGVALVPLAKMPAKFQKQFKYDPIKAKDYLQAEQAQRQRMAAAAAAAATANLGKRVMLCGKVIQAYDSSALVEASAMEEFTNDNGTKLGKYTYLGTVLVTGVFVHKDDLAHWVCVQGKDTVVADRTSNSRRVHAFSFAEIGECLSAFANPEQP